jgi:hypothetical protein
MRRSLLAGLVGIMCLAALAVGRTAGAAEPGYSLHPVVSGFGNLTYITSPRGSPDLYVVERTGKVWVLQNGTRRRADPFADFSGILDSSQDDNGLLSIVFSLSYSTNHLVYIDYTDSGGNIRVDEFRSDGVHVVMASQRHILSVFDPIQDH